jgi:hypothetical protein
MKSRSMLLDFWAAACRPFLRKLILLTVAICWCEPLHAQGRAGAQDPQQLFASRPGAKAFLPPSAVLIKELTVDFGDGSGTGIALAYAIPDQRSPYDFTVGIRVLERKTDPVWAVAYEDTDFVSNGAGASDGFNIEKVSTAEGKEALVVIVKFSGAGTTTDWHLVAFVAGRFRRLDSAPLRGKVLKGHNYEFMGYNGVAAKGDLVTENIPGYSRGQARCCPDRPSIDVIFRFTGDSITLQSVKELPFAPPQ